MAELLNMVRMDGLYNDETPVWMETELTIEMVALSIRKTADQTVWANGPLTYTITLENNDTTPITDITLLDTLEFEKVTFEEGSLTLNGTPMDPSQYQYDPETGALSISLGDIQAEETAIVSFRVNKVA